jgi:hypothetical protein
MADEATLNLGEHHPAADSAMEWYKLWLVKTGPANYILTREAIASSALSGNRLAEICNGTLDRLDKNEPVSDRYLLGLCWMLKEMEEKNSESSTGLQP